MRWRTVLVGSLFNLPLGNGEGHEWTVSEGWEVRVMLVHDIFSVANKEKKDPDVAAALRARFVEEKMFVEEIDALVLELDHDRRAGEEEGGV